METVKLKHSQQGHSDELHGQITYAFNKNERSQVIFVSCMKVQMTKIYIPVSSLQI